MQTNQKRPATPTAPNPPTVEHRRTICVGGNQGRGDPTAFAKPTSMRSWWMEFDNDGAPVNWSGTAANETDAEAIARLQLAIKHGDFDRHGARLVACLER